MIGQLPKSQRDLIALETMRIRSRNSEIQRNNSVPNPLHHNLPVQDSGECGIREPVSHDAVGRVRVGDSVSGIYDSRGVLSCGGN